MSNFKDFSEKDKLNIMGLSIFIMNIIIYVCILFCADVVIKYDLFHKTVPLTDYRILLLPFAFCVMLLFIMFSYYMLDTDAEPVFNIFRPFIKLDFYLRVCVVIVTFILLVTTINMSSKVYLYIFILGSFVLNLYLENNIKKIISLTSDVEIIKIKNKNFIKLTEDLVIRYKESLKYGKITFFVMVSTTLFYSVLNNILTLVIFFLIYSYITLFLLKNIYFALYEKTNAIYKMFAKYLILICGFILVILFNEKIIAIKIYRLSPQEIISLIGIFTFPLYYPVRKVYLGLKRSNNLS